MMTEFRDFLSTIFWMGLVYGASGLFLITLGRLLEDPFTNLADRIQGRDWPSRGPFLVIFVISAAWLVSFWGAPATSTIKENADDRP